jgi:hypothetical protein
MHATASYIQNSNVYPSFLSYPHPHHYLNNSIGINTSSTHYSNYGTDLHLSKGSDDSNDNQPLSPSLSDPTNNSIIPRKKRSRIVPDEEKDSTYYQKRERNNESAKRSRDARRIKEEEIQQRVLFLQHENSRLSMENQAIRYRISQFQALRGGISKPLQ